MAPKEDGFANVSVEHVAQHGIFGGGVLVDLPRLYELNYLPPGTVITAAHLEAWEKHTGTTIGSGDILLLRIGRWQIAKEQPNYDALETTAGVHASIGPWLKALGVAAIGCDAISDVMPSGVESVFNPVHTLANAALGMPIFDHLLGSGRGDRCWPESSNLPVLRRAIKHSRRDRITSNAHGYFLGVFAFVPVPSKSSYARKCWV